MTHGTAPRLALEPRAHYVPEKPAQHPAARRILIAAMQTNKPNFGTLFVFLLALLFAAAAPLAASTRLAERDATVSAAAGTMKTRAEARPLSENEWIENDALEGGSDAPDPVLAGSSSYPAGFRLHKARARAPAGLLTHGAYRQAPPATGPPSA